MTNEEILDILEECRTQLEYLDHRWPTGSTSAVLDRLTTLIDKINREVSDTELVNNDNELQEAFQKAMFNMWCKKK